MSARMVARLSVGSLSIRRGRRTVIEDLTLDADAGVLALVGSNGAGKSTFLRAVATLGRVSGGAITVAGCDLRTRGGRRTARRAIGYLAQSPDFPPSLRVDEAVRYAAWLHCVERAEEATRRALDELRLGPVAGERLGSLSGGTHRRAMLAMAVVHEPEILLLDEPTVGMDIGHRLALREYLDRTRDRRLVVMATHLTEDIELLADDLMVLGAGRLLYRGDPAALLDHAHHDPGGLRPIEAALRALDRSQG